MKKRVMLVAATLFASAAFAGGVAEANSATSNANGCNKHGENSWYSGYFSGTTTSSNCAPVQVKLYTDGGVFSKTEYDGAVSKSANFYDVSSKTDHNARNSSGVWWGFALTCC